MRTALATLAVMAFAAAAPAVAQDKEPDWLKRPTPDMLRAVWPKGAPGRGSAVIGCKVSLQGLLFDCRVISETPAGSGFGSAAVSMTPQLLMKPALKNGQPVVGYVRIPMRFSVPGGGPLDTYGSKAVIRPAMAWKRAPTYGEVAALYPPKAKAAAVGGLVSLQCSLTTVGTLRGCDVTREEPKGYGFSAAAREVAKLFQAFPAAPDGKPLIASVVQLPVAFDPSMLKDGTPTIGKPTWATLPTAEAMIAAFPKAPDGVDTIRVTLQCQVEQGGAVSGCNVQREEPAGSGFGAGAVKVAREFRLGTWSMEGLPVVGGLVNIPIRYQFTGPAAAAPK